MDTRSTALLGRLILARLLLAGFVSVVSISSAHAAVTSCTVNTTLDDEATASGTVTAATASGPLRN
jgi:hypothetical protein